MNKIYEFGISNYFNLSDKELEEQKRQAKITAITDFIKENIDNITSLRFEDYLEVRYLTLSAVYKVTIFAVEKVPTPDLIVVDDELTTATKISANEREKILEENMQLLKDRFDFSKEPMVTFDMCNNNMGAVDFMMKAYQINGAEAEYAFKRMHHYKICGDKLYMIWNDCCDRNTEKAIRVMKDCSIDFILTKLNYEHGRGIKITSEEMEENENETNN